MTRGRLLPLLIGTVLLAPSLAFGQQADDPWGGLRANGERPPAAPRAPAPPPRPPAPAATAPASRPPAPAAAQAVPAAPAAAAPVQPVASATASTPAAPAAATPARAVPVAAPARPATPTTATPATAATAAPAAPVRAPVATAAAPLPLPRPAEAPPREQAAVPAVEPVADPAPTAMEAVEPSADADAPQVAEAASVPAAPAAPIDPIAAAAAAANSEKGPARMPNLPGESPLAAAAYGIMAAFAPISEAAAAVPPVAPPEAAPSGALPRAEARVMDVNSRAGTPAIPVAPAPVVLPTMTVQPDQAPTAAPPSVAAAPAVAVAPAPAPSRPAAPQPAAATAIPVSAPPVPAPAAGPQPAAPVQVALANPASVIPPGGPGQAPLGKVETSPGSARAPLWPQDLVRALRRAQDSMAQGSAPALEAQRALIARIEQEFASADAATWQDPHNARAAVTYFLSGGNPAILRRMMDMQPPPAIDPRLLRGTLAYLEGREDESLRQLKDIDARSLPPSLGGQVALAQAALHVRKEPAKSAQLLTVARLLAPGTLVEEAALRRAILIASQLGDAAQFEYLSKQYLFRFRNSVYAGNFRQRFAAALSRIGFGNDPAQFHRLDAMLDMLEPDSRREMELTVARAAVVQGLTTTANFAADRALAALPDGSDEAERARLYRGASMAANPNTYKDALTDLGSIDKDRLAPADAALLAAASATAEHVRRATEPQPALAPKAAQAAGPLTKDEMLPVMDRARAAINNADAMLKGTAR